MGRIEQPPAPLPFGMGDDAVSLLTQSSMDEMMDTPPAYSDASTVIAYDHEPLLATAEQDLTHKRTMHIFKKFDESELLMDNQFDTDTLYAEYMVRQWAEVPAQQMIRIRGTHTDSSRNVNEKKVVDFDIQIPMVEYLLDARRQNPWSEMRVVKNHEKTYRGSIVKMTGPAGRKRDWDAEEAYDEPEHPSPPLKEWCHLYCASYSPLKSFRVTRTVTGLNTTYLHDSLQSLVHLTNYRGHTRVTFPIANKTTEVHSATRMNTWRFNQYVRTLFYVTFLWIFVWPYLFFATKRWAVVKIDWPYSKTDEYGVRNYLQVSEETWFARWEGCIERAVLSKKQGMLTMEDLVRFETPREPFRSGSLAVDRVVEVVGAGIRGVSEVRRQWGWGGDC